MLGFDVVRVGFIARQYIISESAGEVVVQVQRSSGGSDVLLTIITVDGTANGIYTFDYNFVSSFVKIKHNYDFSS